MCEKPDLHWLELFHKHPIWHWLILSGPDSKLVEVVWQATNPRHMERESIQLILSNLFAYQFLKSNELSVMLAKMKPHPIIKILDFLPSPVVLMMYLLISSFVDSLVGKRGGIYIFKNLLHGTTHISITSICNTSKNIQKQWWANAGKTNLCSILYPD